METISNIAAAASKAIYGDQTTAQQNETAGNEPVSGQTGKGTVNEPYDQGNATNPISTSTHPTSNTISKASSNNTTTLTPKMESNNPFNSNTTHGSDPTGLHDSHLGNKADPRVDSDTVSSQGNTTGASANPFNSNTESNTSGGLSGNTTGGSSNPLSSTESNAPSSIPTNPNNAATGGAPRPHETTDKTGVIGGHGDPFKTTGNVASESSSNPGVVGGSDAGLTKQQGAANPNDEPTTGHQKSAVKEGKEDAEDFLKTKDPNDHSGEPMHMHLGAGDGTKVPKTQEERRESTIGNPGGQEHGKEQSEGTGEQWVKTSGMAADGGDFDATKPGAGREADSEDSDPEDESCWRKTGKILSNADMGSGLMEQKGIHKTAPGKPSEPLGETTSHGSHGEKEKVPLGQKIKEKLHIGSKDK